MNISRKILTLLGGAALVAGILLIPSSAFAQGYGHGLYHHSEHGALGAAGHYTYGDHYANQRQMHHQGHYYGTPQYSAPQYSTPVYSTPMYSQAYAGTTMPQTQYSGAMSQGAVSQGTATGNLYPGMVLPDGSVVVSVGQ